VFVKFKRGDRVKGHRGTGVDVEIIRADDFAKCYDLMYSSTGNVATSIDAGWIEEQYDFPYNGVALFMATL
jgi:hypothetical protein